MDFPRLVAWIKNVPGYDAKAPQVLGHDAKGNLAWLVATPAAKKQVREPPAAKKPA